MTSTVTSPNQPPSFTTAPAGYRLYHAVAMVFVASLLIANTIAVKIIEVGPFTLPAGIIVFPLAYIFGDVLTEVYGFRKAKSIIYWGFAGLAMMALFYFVATRLRPAGFWPDQEPFQRLFGFVPRIVGASFLAYLCGELLNAIVLSRLKVATNGRHFWLRATTSTLVGQGADSIIFNFVAFLGVFAFRDVLVIAFSGWVLKSAYEVLALPLTYLIANYLKRIEGVDAYDRDVRYSPLPSLT
jgi:queuosine precursor transporter